MTKLLYVTVLLLAGVFALPAQTPTAAQMKSDLIGQTMGGRQRCWKFQSVDQIKELVVKDTTADAQKRVCVVALQLQATNASGKYAAEARVEYTRTDTGWKIKQVGLRSLKKME